ncbi:hypothetical protein [Aeromonas veronii]|nr:hypothetical protein [Aeromonas veronii]
MKNEAETRSDHIDPMLVAAGWGGHPEQPHSPRVPHHPGAAGG